MKQVANAADVEGVAVPREGQPKEQPPRTDERVHRKGNKGKSAEESRCSLDPLRDTDRYRLVTPYFDSSKDL